MAAVGVTTGTASHCHRVIVALLVLVYLCFVIHFWSFCTPKHAPIFSLSYATTS